MNANRGFAVGAAVAVLLGTAWVTRHHVIECDQWSCVVQNRWTGVIRRVSVAETENLTEDTTLVVTMDSVLPRSDTVSGNQGQVRELYGFLDRCREAGVPVSACESMSADENVIKREADRNAAEPAGFQNRRLVRLACVVHNVDRDICWRWMPQ
jgi:hypothetical protein